MNIKNFHHLCIQTETYRESLDFYTKVLGFQCLKESPGFHTRTYNTWLQLGAFRIELQTPKAGTQLKPWSSLNSGPVHFAMVVDNVEAAYATLVERGHKRFKLKHGKPVYSVEGGKLLKVIAPEGTEIELRDQQEI